MTAPNGIDPAKPHAFLSYTRADDAYLRGDISWLRNELESAVQTRSGIPFQIFQDIEGIQFGENWERKLSEALESAQLFIPILTPSFFASDFCRREAEAFLDYEARANRDDLILPIYLISADVIEDPKLRAKDILASRLYDRQFADLRKQRFQLRDPSTLPKIDMLAETLAQAMSRRATPDLGFPDEMSGAPLPCADGPPSDLGRQRLQMTAYHPVVYSSDKWQSLLVYLHSSVLAEAVAMHAAARLEAGSLHGKTSDNTESYVELGSEVTIVPHLPGCRFDPPVSSFTLEDDINFQDIWVAANPDSSDFHPGKTVYGTLSFYVSSVLIGEITISGMILGSHTDANSNIGPDRIEKTTIDAYKKIFVSYSHGDERIVEKLGEAYKALGLKFMRDVEILRSGEYWSSKIKKIH